MNADKICYASFSTPADFNGSPLYGNAPLVVNFNDLSTVNNPTAWLWDFGDTSSGSGITSTHVYRTPGMFTVSLAVTGSGGTAQARKMDYVTVGVCANKPARINSSQYYNTITNAYGALGSSGSIDLQAMEFPEAVSMTAGKTVALIGGYACDYGTIIDMAKINGSLMIGGSSGTLTISGIELQ
jgi:PKD repeat protein